MVTSQRRIGIGGWWWGEGVGMVWDGNERTLPFPHFVIYFFGPIVPYFSFGPPFCTGFAFQGLIRKDFWHKEALRTVAKTR